MMLYYTPIFYRESKTMMMNTEERFAEAENSWDLERLYTDLGKAKGRTLTAKDKLYLRGLLCGYGPAEMAKKCHKSAGGLKVNLSKTLYQYVKILVNKENDKLENWTNIREWLEEIGYKRSAMQSQQSGHSLSIYAPNAKNISVKNNRIDISFENGGDIGLLNNNRIDISFENGGDIGLLNIGLQLAIPSSESSKED